MAKVEEMFWQRDRTLENQGYIDAVEARLEFLFQQCLACRDCGVGTSQISSDLRISLVISSRIKIGRASCFFFRVLVG